MATASSQPQEVPPAAAAEPTVGSRLAALRRLFARSDDPYAGADLNNARRHAGLMRAALTLIGAALLPIAPPTRGPAAVSWSLAAVAVLVPLVAWRRMNRPGHASFDRLYAMAFVSLGQIALVQWLAGKGMAPYTNLFLPLAIVVAAVHPPRRLVVFLAVLLPAGLAPLAYGGLSGVDAAYVATQAATWILLAVVIAVPMTHIRAQRQRAAVAARIDSLTGLANRRAFDADAERLLAAARRSGEPLGVMLVDLDRFKDVNDRYGHPEGDRCLRAVAAAIRAAARAADAAYRWGGDEFAVLAPGAGDDELALLAERLTAAVRDAYRSPDGEPVAVTCGSAALRDVDGGGDVVEVADRLLMAAKRASRVARSAAPGEPLRRAA